MLNLTSLKECHLYQKQCMAAVLAAANELAKLHDLGERLRADKRRPATKQVDEEIEAAIKKLELEREKLSAITARIKELSAIK